MKPPALLLAMCVCIFPAVARQTTEHPKLQKIEMECRDPVSTGRTLKPDELLINGMACKIVKSEALNSPVSSVSNAANPAPPQPRNEQIANEVSAQPVRSNDKDDYPLKLHIIAIEMEQGNTPVSGSGHTDNNGNYSSHVGGGGTYYWHLFTGKIDGDPVTYKFSTRPMRGFMKRAAILHIGDYSARWNKNGSLEVQYLDGNGNMQHETFRLQAASKDQPSPDKQ